jgi:hypothetical protein
MVGYAQHNGSATGRLRVGMSNKSVCCPAPSWAAAAADVLYVSDGIAT